MVTSMRVVPHAGGALDELLVPGTDGRIGTQRLDAGPEGGLEGALGDECAWLVVEATGPQGGRIVLDGTPHDIAPRTDVFSAPGWSAFLAPASTFTIAGDGVRATLVWTPSVAGVDGGPTRAIEPHEVRDEARGDGVTARRVRTYIDAGPLVVGETLNPPGGWSSWPPHAHAHEEIYLYRFQPEHGFGVHVDVGADACSPDGDTPQLVRDGDIVRIRSGHHPVVAAPGCTMYYLWALAGDAPTPDTRVDPRFT
jgi:5-deoxy-glucuronate isomerase